MFVSQHRNNVFYLIYGRIIIRHYRMDITLVNIVSRKTQLPVISSLEVENKEDIEWIFKEVHKNNPEFTFMEYSGKEMYVSEDGTGIYYKSYRSGYGNTIETSKHNLVKVGETLFWNQHKKAVVHYDVRGNPKVPEELLELIILD